MRCVRLAILKAVASISVFVPCTARAGGTGENMLLVVNPNDENALRLTNAYASLRNIPASNIVYLAPPTQMGYTDIQISDTQFMSSYASQLPGIISQRGLSGQIDYIATIGSPMSFKQNGGTDPIHPAYGYVMNSMGYALSNLTQYQGGMSLATVASISYNGSRKGENAAFHPLQSFPVDYTRTDASGNYVSLGFNYTPGSNTDIHHSTVYADGTQFYMAGNVGYYGRNATVTVQQLINNLAYTVSGDGTKPQGRIYFEYNTDPVRAGFRYTNQGWSDVSAYMSAHNIPYIVEGLTGGTTPGNAPLNRTDVRGAIIGNAAPVVPNGSTYLPGSLADNQTSTPSTYTTSDQTKSGRFFVAGAAATYGNAIGEPPDSTMPSAHVFLNDGSTIGEAIYKSMFSPYGGQVQGDMLSQAYADVPRVSLNGAPANNATVSGSLNFGASASLNNPAYATGIARLQLYVDGKAVGSPVNAGTGSFSLDTTTLSDGVHELRVVATNDASAASQGYSLSNIVVNNRGESVSATGSSYSAAWNQQLSIPVAAVAGTGGVSQVQLLSFGRNVGQIQGASGNISLDANKLAYGSNTITPVAIMADGTQVAGLPITVTRDFNRIAGQAITPPAQRIAGFQYDYFTAKAGKTLATTDFSGTPDYSLVGSGVLQIAPNDATAATRNIPDAYRIAAGGSNVGLAARITGRFQVTAEGEYGFSFNPYQCRWTSLQLLIDGVSITNYDQYTGSGSTFNSQGLESGLVDTNRLAYLMAGEHTLTFLMATYNGQSSDALLTDHNFLTVTYPDGTAKIADGTFFYTAVPEPASLVLLPLGFLALTRRGRDSMSRCSRAQS